MNLLTLLPLLAALAFPLTAAAAENGKHEHSDSHKLELNAGKKWPTDKPLRQAMSALRVAVHAAIPGAHSGSASDASYRDLSKVVRDQAAYMVQNCKLEPKADAQLHVLVADIMAAADVLESQADSQQKAAAVHALALALNAYGKHFAHPKWQAFKV